MNNKMRVLLWSCLLCLQPALGLGANKETVVVELPEYVAEGFRFDDGHGQQADIFLGIPFAQPPVDDLRFERPQALPKSNKVISARKFAPACHAQEDMTEFKLTTSEDCLYLNVFTPANKKQDEKLPVLVFIHGGGFVYGASSIYGYKTFVENFVSRGIVVVTIQYRIAFMGFLSTGDSLLPGNLGLWDQTAALHFISRNIGQFGGDSARVTVWGHSAASASVHALSISPHSRALFQQVIQMSGSLIGPWAANEKMIDLTKSLLPELNCQFDDSAMVKSCLKKVPVERFWKALKPFHRLRDNTLSILHWSARYDSEFFDGKSVGQLTAEAPKKNIIYGVTDGDALFLTLKHNNIILSVFADRIGVTVDEQVNFSRDQLIDIFHRFFVSEERVDPKQREAAAQTLIKHYTEGEKSGNERFYYQSFVDVWTDSSFFTAVHLEQKEKQMLGWNQFMFVFDYVRDEHLPHLGIPHAPHGYEFYYLSDMQPFTRVDRSSFSAEERNLKKVFAESFVAFVATGNPSNHGLEWPALDGTSRLPFFRLGRKMGADQGFLTPKVQLWERMMDQHGYSICYSDFHVQRWVKEKAGTKDEL